MFAWVASSSTETIRIPSAIQIDRVASITASRGPGSPSHGELPNGPVTNRSSSSASSSSVRWAAGSPGSLASSSRYVVSPLSSGAAAMSRTLGQLLRGPRRSVFVMVKWAYPWVETTCGSHCRWSTVPSRGQGQHARPQEDLLPGLAPAGLDGPDRRAAQQPDELVIEQLPRTEGRSRGVVGGPHRLAPDDGEGGGDVTIGY